MKTVNTIDNLKFVPFPAGKPGKGYRYLRTGTLNIKVTHKNPLQCKIMMK